MSNLNYKLSNQLKYVAAGNPLIGNGTIKTHNRPTKGSCQRIIEDLCNFDTPGLMLRPDHVPFITIVEEKQDLQLMLNYLFNVVIQSQSHALLIQEMQLQLRPKQIKSATFYPWQHHRFDGHREPMH